VKWTVRARIERGLKRGQVAQVVERSPEKAGVGGSTPSLATMFSIGWKDFINLYIVADPGHLGLTAVSSIPDLI
jgi:hypothetical protein